MSDGNNDVYFIAIIGLLSALTSTAMIISIKLGDILYELRHRWRYD